MNSGKGFQDSTQGYPWDVFSFQVGPSSKKRYHQSTMCQPLLRLELRTFHWFMFDGGGLFPSHCTSVPGESIKWLRDWPCVSSIRTIIVKLINCWVFQPDSLRTSKLNSEIWAQLIANLYDAGMVATNNGTFRLNHPWMRWFTIGEVVAVTVASGYQSNWIISPCI